MRTINSVVDTHCHAWDAHCKYVSGTAYLPADFMPLEGLLAQWDAHGVTAGVLVQPSFLGPDNGYLLNALASHPDRLRGIIIAEPERDLPNIDHMHRAGVRGFRFNLISAAPLPDLNQPAWHDWLDAAKTLGWHIVAAGSSRQLAASLPPLLDTGLPVVIDHWGLPDVTTGAADTQWRQCLAAAARHAVWFKLSAPYRLGAVAAAHLLPHIIDATGPSRVLWGSDWPCTRHEECRDFPALLRLPSLRGDAADTLLRQCGANACALYGLPPTR
jgi:predicted TIM-barrel fold metal-dependent hydrolase